jgi:hypothetical protein
MKGMTLTFNKQVAGADDAMGNPTHTITQIVIEDCLVAPVLPAAAREQQAPGQSRDQVDVHLPKTTDADISDSTFAYGGKVFTINSDSVVFMPENTPTRWHRYVRAECING